MKPFTASTLFIGRNLIELDTVSSTNDYASDLLSVVARRPPEGTVISASYQTSGRGQRGTEWVSESGKNLILSIILYPDFLPVQDQFVLNQAISLGVLDFAQKMAGDELYIKWPNDIYRKNKKLGGILIENTLRQYQIVSSLVGIGLNVNQYTFYKNAPNPTSFLRITKKHSDLNECKEQLFHCLEARYLQLKAGKFETLRSEYLQSLYLFGKLRFFDTPAGPVRGSITGISREGKIELTLKDGTKKQFGFKEIRFR